MDCGLEDSVDIGIFSNAIVFISSNYLLLQPVGCLGIKDSSPLIRARLESRRKWARFYKSVRDFNFVTLLR